MSKPTEFQKIIEGDFIIIPKVSHKETPPIIIKIIPSDTSETDFVFNDLISWGVVARAVNRPAIVPTIS